MEGTLDTFSREKQNKKPFYIIGALAALICISLIFAEGIFNVSFGYTPFISFGIIVWLISFIEPTVGFGLLILTIAISPEFTFFNVPNIRLEDFLFPAVLMSWLAQSLFRKDKFIPTDLKLPIIFLIFLSLASSLQNYVYKDLTFLTSFFRITKGIEYFLMFFVALNIAKGKQNISRYIHLLWIAAGIATLYSLFKLQVTPTILRLNGLPGETANIFGGFLIFHICIVLGISSTIPKMKILGIVIAIAMAVPFVHTLSRTSYIALFFGLILLTFLTKDRNIIIFLVITGVMIIFTQARDRFETILGIVSGNPPSSWEARIAGWKEFIPNMINAPLFGRGLGSSTLAIDNEYVRQIYELGLLGFILFCWLIWRSARTAFKISREEETPLFRGFAMGYLAGLAALLVHGIAATTFTTIRTTEPFFIATGLLYGILAQMPVKEKQPELPQKIKPIQFHRSTTWKTNPS